MSTVLSSGANVHKMVKKPGGYFSNKEIEQVMIYNALSAVAQPQKSETDIVGLVLAPNSRP